MSKSQRSDFDERSGNDPYASDKPTPINQGSSKCNTTIMKTKYRIVKNGLGQYLFQRKLWMFPHWEDVTIMENGNIYKCSYCETYETIEEAESALTKAEVYNAKEKKRKQRIQL